MNTRFRRPLQAVALLFSLTLFIGYLWLTQRQSGLPSIEAFPLADDSPSDPFLNPPTVHNTAEHITIKPPTGGEFEELMKAKTLGPEGKATPLLMPGSKSISQPVFSTRKVAQPVNPPAPAPIMPSSKLGIFALPIFSFDPSIQQNSMMSSSKSAPVFSSRPNTDPGSIVPTGTIKGEKPANQIHRMDPP